jgi:glycosyltransferase involved in cell wall biosynthesis
LLAPYCGSVMRVLFFGTYDADSHPRVAVLRDGLAAALAGTDLAGTVDECNVPLGLSTAARVSMLRRPWQLPRLVLRLAACWARLIRCARRRPRPDVVVVGYLGHFDVLLARRLFRDATIVLDHLVGASDTATDRGVSGGLRQRLLRGLDSRALAASDIVVVDTAEHLAALPATHRAKAVVVAVGAPTAWFNADDAAQAAGAEADRSEAARSEADRSQAAGSGAAGSEGAWSQVPSLSVVFFGLYTPLQGTPTIGAALAAVADAPINVTMIGSGQDLAETRSLASANAAVTWLDWVDAADLPEIVARHDVCLGIFGSGPKARRVVPNKVFQGAAVGTAIITSDTPPQRRALGDAAVFVPPGDSSALAAALRTLAADRDRLDDIRAAAHRLARDEFAPAHVVAPLAAQISVIMKDPTGSSSRPDPS